MIPTVSLRQALSDAQLMHHVMTAASYRAQKVLAIAAMGEDLSDDERAIFTKFTQRQHEPSQRCREFAIIAGRRTAKTLTAAMLATYLATCVDYSDVLVAGETGVVLCLAQSQKIATKILDFVETNLKRSPILRQRFVSRTLDTIELTNNISVEVRPASARNLRGPSYCAIIADELSFWPVGDDYQNPDVQVLAAARPGLLTTRGPLIMMSSPYSKRGVLWDTFHKHYGPSGSSAILVAKGTTADLNPTIPQSEIDGELERDPVRNRAEYLAEFRTDIEGYVNAAAVAACTAKGIFERPPRSDQSYFGFADPSGGSQDAFALAIGHIDYARQTVVVDAVYERRPPFSPEQVCEEFARHLRRYSIASIKGDHYAGIWPAEQFARFGISYEASAPPKSDLYRDMLPLLNSCRLSLLDHPRLIGQLSTLERSTARSGKDTIDHAPGAHDDLINVVAGLCAQQQQFGTFDPTYAAFQPGFVDRDRDAEHDVNAAWRRARLATYVLSGGRLIP